MIGILDSGVGGLSVLREVKSLLPDHDITYIGDNSWCPYGSKSYEEICARTFALTEKLIALGAEVIVIACNSATIAAIEALRAHFPISFIGMEPGVKPAAKHTKTGTIGVLATQASLRGDKFHHLIAEHAKDLRVITQPCPSFVELIEQGTLAGPQVESAITEYTSTMINAEADVIILGCSHYPFLRPALAQQLPENIHFIDTGAAIARRVSEQNLRPSATPNLQVLTTGDPAHFQNIASQLVPELIFTCQLLDLSND